MNHKELVDQVSSSIFKETGKFESRKSWLAMRNYLEQLNEKQDKIFTHINKKQQTILNYFEPF